MEADLQAYSACPNFEFATAAPLPFSKTDEAEKSSQAPSLSSLWQEEARLNLQRD